MCIPISLASSSSELSTLIDSVPSEARYQSCSYSARKYLIVSPSGANSYGSTTDSLNRFLGRLLALLSSLLALNLEVTSATKAVTLIELSVDSLLCAIAVKSAIILALPIGVILVVFVSLLTNTPLHSLNAVVIEFIVHSITPPRIID